MYTTHKLIKSHVYDDHEKCRNFENIIVEDFTIVEFIIEIEK